MTPEEIRKKVDTCFEDGGMGLSSAGYFLEKAKSLIHMGIEHDADAICYVHATGEDVSVLVVVGRSTLMGEDAYKWIFDYHNNSPSATKRCVERIAEFAVEAFSDGDVECVMPFRDTKNKAWRSFGGELKTVDEVRKRAFMKLGRKTDQ